MYEICNHSDAKKDMGSIECSSLTDEQRLSSVLPWFWSIIGQLAFDCSEEAFQHDIRDLPGGIDVRNEVLFLS